MAKAPLPPLYPWYRVAAAHVWLYVTWPRTVREMKRLGFRRIGFMTWEAGPDDG